MNVRPKRNGYARLKLTSLIGVTLAVMPFFSASADPSPILLLGISRDGSHSSALTTAAGDRLSRVGESILIPPGLSKEDRSCTQVSCLASLAKRLHGKLLVSGRIRTTGNRAAVELFVYDARTQRIATELASCNGCTDNTLAAQVAALAGQLFDKNTPPRDPVATVPVPPPVAPRPLEPSGPELQRLVSAVDRIQQQVERAAVRAESASTTAQQLKTTLERSAERLEGTAATVQQLKLTVDKSAERTQGTMDTMQQLRTTLDRLDKRVDRAEANTTSVTQLKFALEKTSGGLESTQAAIAGAKEAAERAAVAAGQANERVGRVQLASEELGKKLTLLGEVHRTETAAPALLPQSPVGRVTGQPPADSTVPPTESNGTEPAARLASPSVPLESAHPPLGLAALTTRSALEKPMPQRRLSLRRKIVAGVFGGLAACSLATTIVFFWLDGQRVATACQNGPGTCAYTFAPTYTTLGSVATGLFGGTALGTLFYPTGDRS